MVTVPQQPLPTGIITTPPTGPTPLFFEGTVGVADMPSWLKQIPNGAVLQATVQGRVSQNTYSLLTAQGPITISSSLALQAGTQLLFQIGPELQSQRLQLVGGTNPNPLPQPILSTTAAPLLPLPQAAAGQTLNAIVIRPADPAPLPSGTPSPGSTGAPTQSALVPTTVPAQAGIAAYASHSVTATPSAPTVLLGTAPAASAPAAPFPGVQAPGPSAPSAGFAPSLSTPAPTPATPATPGAPSASASASSTAAGIAPYAGGRASPAPTVAASPTVASPSVPVPASAPADLSVFAVTQAGEQVTVRVVAVTPPQPDPATMVKSGNAATSAAPTPASTPFAFLREGLAALLSASPASTTAPTIGTATTGTSSGTSPQPAGPVLTGTVIGNGAQNRPIIAVGSAILSLEAGPLPPGSQVQLVAQLNAPAATPNTLATPAQAQPPLQSFPTYPSLPALIAAAQQIGGPTEQAIRAMLPQIGPQLAASLMVFASGAAKGDVRTLVGDSARAALERSARGRAAIQGLTQEFEAAEDEAHGTPAADWRAITLPVMTGGAMIEPIRLYLHQVSDEEAERNRNNEGGGQRFVLDLDLTQLGVIQIDGLAKHDKLDLVVRTPTPLPETVRDGLRAAFLGGATAYGVIGGLTFQVGPRLVLDTGQPAVRRGGLYV